MLQLKAIRNQPVLRLVKGVDQAVTLDHHGVFGSSCRCHKQAADGTVPATMAAPIQKKFQGRSGDPLTQHYRHRRCGCEGRLYTAVAAFR